MQKALIYCRVSTEEQAEKGFSLDAQEKFCRNFAKDNGYTVTTVYRDEGKSATSLNRPALQDLLSKCQQDKSIDAAIVQETDRLARNTKDHLTIKALLKKADVKLISVAQPMLDDSPEGNMIDTILASVNQFQSDINSRKTKKGLQERFDEGWYPGWAPLGYINVPLENSNERKAKKIIKKDSDKWYLLKEGFKLYLSGNYSVLEINDILHKKGLRSRTGKRVAHSTLTGLLKNSFYTGLMEWNGQKKMGKHTAMITLNQHQRIAQIMDSHNLHACRRRKHFFVLRGFVFCNICGQRYTADKHVSRNKEYYHCSAPKRKHSNRGQNVAVEDLEKQVENQFKKIQFSQKFVDIFLERLRIIYHQQKEVIESGKKVLFNQKKAIERKRDKAEEKLLKGVLSDDDFMRMKVNFREELAGIQARIDELDQQKDYDVDVIQEIVKLLHNIYNAYKTAPYELKRQYLGLFFEKFLVQNKKIVEAVPTKIVQVLAQKQDVLLSSNLLRRLDSNQRPIAYTYPKVS